MKKALWITALTMIVVGLAYAQYGQVGKSWNLSATEVLQVVDTTGWETKKISLINEGTTATYFGVNYATNVFATAHATTNAFCVPAGKTYTFTFDVRWECQRICYQTLGTTNSIVISFE